MGAKREALAWAAGFYDGEGSCSYTLRILRSGTHQRAIYMQLAQVNRLSLDRFLSAVEVGSVKGPYQPRNKKARPYWMWRTSGLSHVKDVADLLWPWLGEEKRLQFIKAKDSFEAFIPVFSLCSHGQSSTKCSLCHKDWANKAWITRRDLNVQESIYTGL